MSYTCCLTYDSLTDQLMSSVQYMASRSSLDMLNIAYSPDALHPPADMALLVNADDCPYTAGATLRKLIRTTVTTVQPVNTQQTEEDDSQSVVQVRRGKNPFWLLSGACVQLGKVCIVMPLVKANVMNAVCTSLHSVEVTSQVQRKVNRDPGGSTQSIIPV
jgi:hypothetical protein